MGESGGQQRGDPDSWASSRTPRLPTINQRLHRKPRLGFRICSKGGEALGSAPATKAEEPLLAPHNKKDYRLPDITGRQVDRDAGSAGHGSLVKRAPLRGHEAGVRLGSVRGKSLGGFPPPRYLCISAYGFRAAKRVGLFLPQHFGTLTIPSLTFQLPPPGSCRPPSRSRRESDRHVPSPPLS